MTRAPTDLTDIQRRIVALLAKAESTTFEAEAQALFAKAQQLMTRYAIDVATLTPGGDLREPVTQPVPSPTGSGAAAFLLAMTTIATANHCVLLRRGGDLGLVGFDDDVRLAMLLFTSVEIQMLRGYAAARQTKPVGVNGNTFRASYLLGYAVVVQERISQAAAETQEEAQAAGETTALALLADRRAQVLDHIGPTRATRRRLTVRSADAFDRGAEDGRLADVGTPAVRPADPGVLG